MSRRSTRNEPPDPPLPKKKPTKRKRSRLAPEMRDRGFFLRHGFVRDTGGPANVTGFLVVAVATVLITRGWLAAAGYPQVGNGSLHIAHALWGGLLMAIAVMILVSFVGPVIRPLSAFVGGVGFGLFIDEIGKLVTKDVNYFYEPTAALIYIVVVALLLLSEALHGRREHHRAEYLAEATDQAVLGVAGGFSERARKRALALVDRGEGEPTADEVRALVEAILASRGDVPDVFGAVGSRTSRVLRRIAANPQAGRVVSLVVIFSCAFAALAGLVSLARGWWFGGVVPAWMSAAALVSGLLSVYLAWRGWVVGPRNAKTGVAWLRRAIIVNLLVTQIFMFRILEWSAVSAALVDVAVFLLLETVRGEQGGPVIGWVKAPAFPDEGDDPGVDRAGKPARESRPDDASASAETTRETGASQTSSTLMHRPQQPIRPRVSRDIGSARTNGRSSQTETQAQRAAAERPRSRGTGRIPRDPGTGSFLDSSRSRPGAGVPGDRTSEDGGRSGGAGWERGSGPQERDDR